MKHYHQTQSALIVIILLTFLLWLVAVPSGNVVGNILAGAIMTVAIAAAWTVKPS